jgi:RNA polymerase sigma-70 factor (ECF subfamily)
VRTGAIKVNENEPKWLDQALKGDPEAFSSLVQAYQTPVFNLCYRMLGDGYEAEDAAQETFLRAYENLSRYDRQRPFSTWLLSIAAHYCIDQIRKRRMILISLDGEPFLDPPDHAPGPEPTLSQREEQRRVQQLLARLSPQDRAAVVMRYWHELSYEEIAASLSLTVSAVKSRLHRARQMLAEGWSEQETKLYASERTRNERTHSPAF